MSNGAVPLQFRVFDATACGFPRPRVPLLPVCCAGLVWQGPSRERRQDAAHFRHYSRGRYALREAYRLAGIGPGSALLAPAYHCRTMIDPALALAGDVKLYPMTVDLTPDLSALEGMVSAGPHPVRAVLATHFFGLTQDLQPLADWCRARGIALVEDCSHALLTETRQASGTGLAGDFVVSSPYKFLPIPDGGLLYARDAARLAGLVPRLPPLSAELRGLVGTSGRLRQHRASIQACRAARLDEELAAARKAAIAPGTDTIVAARYSESYHAAAEGLAPLRLSRLIGHHEDVDRLVRRRRANYRRWTAGLAGLPNCRPLYPELAEDSIPYMVPTYIDRPEWHFALLKHLGMPIWRWDSIAVSDCPVAQDYRLRLLHLPCHQSLTDDELDWMIAAVRRVMGMPPGETA